MTKVKICGITNLDDAEKACELGADLLGFIFIEDTPRVVDAGTVKEILSGLSGELKTRTGKVGLFKDQPVDEVVRIAEGCGLDHIQLQGNEEPGYCLGLKSTVAGNSMKIIKAFKVEDELLPIGEFLHDDYRDVDYFVFDTFHPKIPGGTGLSFDWSVLKKERDRIEKPFFIAGGLNPENVADAVKTVQPYGVDVSSGVEESPGKKSVKLLKEFIKNAKEA